MQFLDFNSGRFGYRINRYPTSIALVVEPSSVKRLGIGLS